MAMPGRNLSNGSSYKYGFAGKEKDDEIKGEGNSYDFGARIYDPRTVTWFSVDPAQNKHADLTPYNFAGNNPVNRVDPDGKDDIHFHFLTIRTKVPDPQRGSRIVFQKVTWVTVIKNDEPNRFIHHTNMIDNDDINGTKGEPTDKVSQIFPSRWNKDYDRLMNLMDVFPELEDLGGAYIRDPAQAKNQQAKNMDFWNDIIKDKRTKENLAEQKKEEFGLILGMVTALIPVEKVVAGVISKIAAEASIDVVAVSKNFKRFFKDIPVNSKGNVTVDLVEDGNILFTTTSPGNVPGSKAIYQKLLDRKGKTLEFIKTTYDNAGKVAHVKDKIKGIVIKMPE